MSTMMNEQEQVDLIKHYWNRYGNLLLTVILVVAVSIVGWRYWQTQQREKRNAASYRYQSLLMSVSKKNITDINAKARGLIKTYPKTVYASLSSLILAAENVNDKQYANAKSDLRWVLANSDQPALQATAKIRLARILLSEKKYADAITMLANIPSQFLGIANMVKGDIYSTTKKVVKARQMYLASIKHLKKADPMYQIVTMKLNDLPVQINRIALKTKNV